MPPIVLAKCDCVVLVGAEDDFDDRIDVGDVDLAIAIHVKSFICISVKDGFDGMIDISNVHLAIAIHITGLWICVNPHDMDEILPWTCSLVILF